MFTNLFGNKVDRKGTYSLAGENMLSIKLVMLLFRVIAQVPGVLVTRNTVYSLNTSIKISAYKCMEYVTIRPWYIEK